MSLRRRIEKSERLAAVLAGIAGRYLAYCDRSTDWTIEGLDQLKTDLNTGPVLLVMWHSRSVLAALHWPVAAGPLSSLYDSSPIGRISGALQRRVGLQPMEMSRKRSNVNASRAILKRVRDGVSIGMTGDGPVGPALLLKDAPLEWARVTQMPLYAYAFSTTKGRRLESWDKMLVPRPRGKGAMVFARYDGDIPRKPDAAETEAVRQSLAAFLSHTTGRADELAGQPFGP